MEMPKFMKACFTLLNRCDKESEVNTGLMIYIMLSHIVNQKISYVTFRFLDAVVKVTACTVFIAQFAVFVTIQAPNVVSYRLIWVIFRNVIFRT